MKKLLVLFCCSVFLLAVKAQKAKEETPAAAKTAFAAKFPTAQKAKWSLEKPGEYEVEFTLNKVESTALFDATGNLLETETEISVGELPQAARTILTKNFAGYKLDEIEKSTDGKGVVSYEMEASKGKVKLELCFDANGKVLSQEPLKKEKD
jgi:uncharacterized membrane protein YkoI